MPWKIFRSNPQGILIPTRNHSLCHGTFSCKMAIPKKSSSCKNKKNFCRFVRWEQRRDIFLFVEKSYFETFLYPCQQINCPFFCYGRKVMYGSIQQLEGAHFWSENLFAQNHVNWWEILKLSSLCLWHHSFIGNQRPVSQSCLLQAKVCNKGLINNEIQSFIFRPPRCVRIATTDSIQGLISHPWGLAISRWKGLEWKHCAVPFTKPTPY